MSIDVAGSKVIEGSVEELSEILAGAIGTASKLHLYQSSFSPGQNNVYADFLAAEATFTGYTAVALTWGPVGVDAAGQAVTYSLRANFEATDGVTPNVIGGCWVSTQTALGPPVVNKAIRFFPFTTPINMATALASMAVVVAMQLPNINGYATVES